MFSQLKVASLFGCAYYLSAEEQGSKQSKEREKPPKPMTVYMDCVEAGKTKEEKGHGMHLPSGYFPWLCLVYFSQFPTVSIFSSQYRWGHSWQSHRSTAVEEIKMPYPWEPGVCCFIPNTLRQEK